MLREEQIDIRKQRGRTGKFVIDNVGKNRVFSEYAVANPESGGRYTVTIRGFDVGDNICTCPDYKANTLGTCKHIEAVLEHLRDELPAQFQKKKAVVTRPEIYLHYGEQLCLGLHLTPRHSDRLTALGKKFFDEKGLWSSRGRFEDLIPAIEIVPEEVTVFADALDFIDREVERADMLARERDWLVQVKAGSFDQNLLSVPLYDYQLRGAIFLASRGRSILGDDMGLGKTLQTLAAVELLARERDVGRVLVVAPSSVKYQWETEIRRFTRRAVQVIDGTPDDRIDGYAEPTFYRLVNYEQVVRDRDRINAWKPDVIVLDEAQRIKNWESKTSKEVKKLWSRYAIVLTGTPLENKLEELYSIVQFVDERRFGPAFQFLHDHRVLDDNGNLTGYRHLDRIREKLEPIFLRRTRGEVLTQLPARTDSTVFVELSDEQRLPYEDQKLALARLLQKSHPSEIDRKRILAALTNMRLVCDSTHLFDKETNHSPKLDEFAELVLDLVPLAPGGRAARDEGETPGERNTMHKLVVFSQWETMIQLAAAVLDRLGVGYTLLHGGLPGKDRKAVLDRFNTDASCRVFLSTDAGGTGLNLQVADTVVNLELPWNPAVLEQRIARVHRLGQSRPVRVVNFVTRGTIEERVLRTLEQKQALFEGLFEGDEDELTFPAIGRSGVLDAVRDLIGEGKETTAVANAPAISTEAAALYLAAVQLLESLPAALAVGKRIEVPNELRQRALAAAAALNEVLRD